MFLMILALVCFAAGIIVWMAGSRVERRAAREQNKVRKKQLRRWAEKLGLTARVILILAAVCFILGFILLQGAQIQ